MKIDLQKLVNENIQLVNALTGKSIAFGCVEKIELNSKNQQVIYFYNSKRNFIFKNVLIQYLIL